MEIEIRKVPKMLWGWVNWRGRREATGVMGMSWFFSSMLVMHLYSVSEKLLALSVYVSFCRWVYFKKRYLKIKIPIHLPREVPDIQAYVSSNQRQNVSFKGSWIHYRKLCGGVCFFMKRLRFLCSCWINILELQPDSARPTWAVCGFCPCVSVIEQSHTLKLYLKHRVFISEARITLDCMKSVRSGRNLCVYLEGPADQNREKHLLTTPIAFCNSTKFSWQRLSHKCGDSCFPSATTNFPNRIQWASTLLNTKQCHDCEFYIFGIIFSRVKIALGSKTVCLETVLSACVNTRPVSTLPGLWKHYIFLIIELADTLNGKLIVSNKSNKTRNGNAKADQIKTIKFYSSKMHFDKSATDIFE